VKAFSGMCILQLALRLGSVYLEKMERMANFRASMRVLSAIFLVLWLGLPPESETAKEPMDSPESRQRREELQVLYLLRRMLGWLFALHRAARCGHSALFFEALCALAPLFPATGSNLYTVLMAKYIYNVRGRGAEWIREQLARWPGIRLHAGGAVLHFDEALEEAIRFLKGSIEARHMANVESLVQHLAHAQEEHRWVVQVLAAYLGDRLGHDGARSRAARSLDLWAAVRALREATKQGLPSASALFETAPYLADEKCRKLVLSCLEQGSYRLLSAIRQHGSKTEEPSGVGLRAKNIPAPLTIAHHVKPKKANQTEVDHMRDALVRMLQSGLEEINTMALTEAERLGKLNDILMMLSPFPPTLASLGGSKPKANKASTISVIEAILGPAAADPNGFDMEHHAVDMLQLVFRLPKGERKIRMLAVHLGQAVVSLLPASATHVFLCFDRPNISKVSKSFEQTDRDQATAKRQSEERRITASVARANELDPDESLDAALLQVDRKLRGKFAILVAELLLAYKWPDQLAVTVDAEGRDDPCQPPITVLNGERRVRHDLQHLMPEANGSMWLHLVRAGSNGVVHSSNVDTTDWGLAAYLIKPGAYGVVYLPGKGESDAPSHRVRIDYLAAALERGGPVKIAARQLPGMPIRWTARQRLMSFVIAKALGGNDYHEPLGVGADVVLRTILEWGGRTGPLVDPDGVVDREAVHRLVLRVFYDLNNLAKVSGFPVMASTTEDGLRRAHEQLQATIAKTFVQAKKGPVGQGLLPSFRAVQLCVARASTYIAYTQSLRTASQAFDGWSSPESGYYEIGGHIYIHWDDDAAGRPVLGPNAPPVPMKRSLSAAATPVQPVRKSSRPRRASVRLQDGDAATSCI